MTETVTMKGKPLNLKGPLLKEGMQAPECALVNGSLETVKLSSFKGKPLLLMTVPSLDTGVCSQEAIRFNQELHQLKETITAVCVSMDLPFAQGRFCTQQKIENIIVLSDYKNRELGEKFGLLIPELGLLARALFLLSAELKIEKVYLVKEITQEPPYSLIINELKQLLTRSSAK